MVFGKDLYRLWLEMAHIREFIWSYIGLCKKRQVNIEWMKILVLKTYLGNSNQAVSNFYIAFAAGAMATIATQPADVLRCHLQIDHKLGFKNFKSHIGERGVIRNIIIWSFQQWAQKLTHKPLQIQYPVNFAEDSTLLRIFIEANLIIFIRALYLDGLAPRITRRSLVSAINWTIFEEAKKFFNSWKY